MEKLFFPSPQHTHAPPANGRKYIFWHFASNVPHQWVLLSLYRWSMSRIGPTLIERRLVVFTLYHSRLIDADEDRFYRKQCMEDYSFRQPISLGIDELICEKSMFRSILLRVRVPFIWTILISIFTFRNDEEVDGSKVWEVMRRSEFDRQRR